ncbi:hypothetical protein LCGC14_2975740, partial [marine sediment metagenome]
SKGTTALEPTDSSEPAIVWNAQNLQPGAASVVVDDGRLFLVNRAGVLTCAGAADGKILWTRSNAYEDVYTAEEVAEANKAKTFHDQKAAAEGQVVKLKRRLKKSPKNEKIKAMIAKLTAEAAALASKAEPYARMALPDTHPVNGHSTPTPVSDGKNVYVMYCLGTVACYDLAGNRKWITFVEKPKRGYGHSSSPVLIGDKLIVHILDAVALDTATGKEVWRAKSSCAWGTGIHVKVAETDLLFTPSGDAIDVADGKVVARRLSKLEFATPVREYDVVYYVQNGGKALKLPAAMGEKFAAKPLWRAKIDSNRYYGSPVIHEGLIYAVTRAGKLSVVDATDGKLVYEKKLGLGKGEFYASIAVAGANVYISN